MSVLFASSNPLIPLTVLGASLLGSGHCLAMCGGLVLAVGDSTRALIHYHLGRLLGYGLLGALAGLLGAQVHGSGALGFLPWLASFLIAAGFVTMGARVWARKPLHLFAVPPRLLSGLMALSGRIPAVRAPMIGFASALLPCGWLHAFVLGAVALGSSNAGALYLTIFWLGTLPALIAAPALVRRVLGPFSRFAPRVSGLLLILLGLSTAGAKFWPRPHDMSCHSESFDVALPESIK